MSHPEVIKLLTTQRKLFEAEDCVKRAEARAVRVERSDREIVTVLQENLNEVK